MTTAMSAWIAACVTVAGLPLILPFQLIFFKIVYLCSRVLVSDYLRPLLLTLCNVISLKYNNTDITEYDHLLCLYFHVCV